MSYYELAPRTAATAVASERAAFVRRTYGHLAGALLAFLGLEAALLYLFPPQVVSGFLGRSPWMLLGLMVAFVGAGWLAQTWAAQRTSVAMQYLGLTLYVVVEALIFLPLMSIAWHYSPEVIPTAGILTAAMFGGLTASVFITRKDYSFLGPFLAIGSMIALGVIVCAIVLPALGLPFFSLGLVFSLLMVALMSGYILYDTSNVLHKYPTDMHVAAALALFASVATLFYWVLRVLVILNGRR